MRANPRRRVVVHLCRATLHMRGVTKMTKINYVGARAWRFFLQLADTVPLSHNFPLCLGQSFKKKSLLYRKI